MHPKSKGSHKGKGSVHEQLDRLGLRTYNTAWNNGRVVLKHKAALQLYHQELPSLFGILLRDEGTILSRQDPQLFDKELEELLQEFGPLIWPEVGKGSREHLFDALAGTLYESDLIYPHDCDT
jgi:hypothetical protein